MGLFKGGSKYASDSFACSWNSFPTFGLSYPDFIENLCLVLLYLVLLCFIFFSLGDLLFPEWKPTGSGSEENGNGGAGKMERRETMIRMYYMREESIFLKLLNFSKRRKREKSQ